MKEYTHVSLIYVDIVWQKFRNSDLKPWQNHQQLVWGAPEDWQAERRQSLNENHSRDLPQASEVTSFHLATCHMSRRSWDQLSQSIIWLNQLENTWWKVTQSEKQSINRLLYHCKWLFLHLWLFICCCCCSLNVFLALFFLSSSLFILDLWSCRSAHISQLLLRIDTPSSKCWVCIIAWLWK